MRLTKEKWFEVGLSQLAEQGPQGVTLEALCIAAERTRGSFYHHFSGIQEFVTQMMEFWGARDTSAVIQTVQTCKNNKTEELNRIASELDHRLEARIRQFAAQDENVARQLSKVDTIRIRFLVDLHMSRKGITPDEAETIARLEHAAYVGAQLLWPEEDVCIYQKLGDTFTYLVDRALGSIAD